MSWPTTFLWFSCIWCQRGEAKKRENLWKRWMMKLWFSFNLITAIGEEVVSCIKLLACLSYCQLYLCTEKNPASCSHAIVTDALFVWSAMVEFIHKICKCIRSHYRAMILRISWKISPYFSLQISDNCQTQDFGSWFSKLIHTFCGDILSRNSLSPLDWGDGRSPTMLLVEVARRCQGRTPFLSPGSLRFRFFTQLMDSCTVVFLNWRVGSFPLM